MAASNSTRKLLLVGAILIAARQYFQITWLRFLLAGFVYVLVIYNIVPFVQGSLIARKSGFPAIYIPWNPHNFLWMVFQVPLRPILKRHLPTSIWNRFCLAIYGWEFHERLRPFEEYAAPQGNRKSFMLVTYHRPEIWTWDAEIISQILARPKDFEVQEFTKLFMDQFGTNVITSNGDHWSKQRRVVASVINERISKAVFHESIRQTNGMLEEVFAGSKNKDVQGAHADTNQIFDMMKKITIHVLSGAGMGANVPWHGDKADALKPGFKTNYMDACKTVTQAVAGAIIVPTRVLLGWPSFLPGYENMVKVGTAKKEFPLHTRDMLNAERKRNALSKDKESRGNIMSQLLQASEGAEDIKGSPALTEEEMVGNLFIFTLAGFDTTANTLSYSMMLLAKHPEWQDWLLEEVDHLMPAGNLASADLEYTDIHPKANRVMAFMLETLRHFPPLVHMVKEAAGDQVLETSSGTYFIPSGTACYLDSVGLHLDPDIWRNVNIKSDRGEAPSDDDELKFRPTRWLNPPTNGTTPIFQPPKGRFIAWSYGPRVCPGQKMAQVEFTAVMLTLLRQHRVEAVPIAEGESREQISDRVEATIRKSISLLTLQMEDVYDVTDAEMGFKLRLTRRR